MQKIINQHNITFYIGKNAYNNYDIINKAKNTDIWFHIDNRPSAHVIAVIPDDLNKKDLQYIIKQGACICKAQSKYKSEKNLSIVYTTIENITKTDIIGSVFVNKKKKIIL